MSFNPLEIGATFHTETIETLTRFARIGMFQSPRNRGNISHVKSGE